MSLVLISKIEMEIKIYISNCRTFQSFLLSAQLSHPLQCSLPLLNFECLLRIFEIWMKLSHWLIMQKKRTFQINLTFSPHRLSTLLYRIYNKLLLWTVKTILYLCKLTYIKACRIIIFPQTFRYWNELKLWRINKYKV